MTVIKDSITKALEVLGPIIQAHRDETFLIIPRDVWDDLEAMYRDCVGLNGKLVHIPVHTQHHHPVLLTVEYPAILFQGKVWIPGHVSAYISHDQVQDEVAKCR